MSKKLTTKSSPLLPPGVETSEGEVERSWRWRWKQQMRKMCKKTTSSQLLPPGAKNFDMSFIFKMLYLSTY